ncbi:Aste57867_11731 [Aphanomyces stellatus]|uniref:Aste57867_11731 protein n=1 Tax=Aphanomyces stellatus TaxID=120398 RepID=A0A485KTS5_9STRA|nr:hypothetical protein As57867_011687 [Aphanomyces stellatus]VFT88588.1 Aste57867_11731 [Aphanomyces stellatus]
MEYKPKEDSVEDLLAAVKAGRVDQMLEIMDRGQVDINALGEITTEYGDKATITALIYASNEGHIEVVRALLSCEGIDINATNNYGASALMYASKMGRTDVVRTLSGHEGIDVNALDKYGTSALMIASEKGRAEIVRILLGCESININDTDKNGKSALMYASNEGRGEVVCALSGCDGIEINAIDKFGTSALMYASEKGHVEVVRAMSGCEGIDINAIDKEGKRPLEYCAKYFDHKAAMKLLLLDMPIQARDGNLVSRQDHSFSWTTFMDVTLSVDLAVRQSCVASILNHSNFASYFHELLHELAFAKDQHGREVIQITDASSRKYFYDQLYFCGRYQIFEGPPVHVSNTAVVVMAYDHGICAQVFQEHKNIDGHLDEARFVTCSAILGRLVAKTKKHGKKQSQEEFRLWDRDASGALSEEEFHRYCMQHFGGKLKVAMKFMRSSTEYNREVKTRMRLNSEFVVHQLPTLEQSMFQKHMPTLKINGDFSMANFGHVLVMAAADRSLDDIFLKERPGDNKTKTLLNEVVLGLQHLHAQGFVHGDLKKLNVLRVQNELKLIDFDAAVRVGQPLGAKYSSGILPPEMFESLENDDDIARHKTYWGRDDLFTRKKAPVKSSYVVKAYRDGHDVRDLPYSLVNATTAVDMWSFGCMVFQMLSGQELVPTDINQNVLRQRIKTFIPSEEAQDLVMRLLVVDPTTRLSATDALNHPYFTGIRDTRAMIAKLEEMKQTQAKICSQVAEVAESEMLRGRLLEKSSETLETATLELERDVASVLLEANDVVVPTSFVVLPCKTLTGDSVDATKVTSFMAHLWNTGKMLQAAKGSSVSALVSKLTADGPLYLYLIDEGTGAVVITEEMDSVYPIEIPIRDDNSFLLMNLPFIQSTFKSLKKGSAAVGGLRRLNLLPSSKPPKDKKEPEQTKHDWTKEIERAIADLPEPTVSFQVLQQALDVKESVAFVRGAALREIMRFFNTHDPSHSFAGLKRVISNQGCVIWTSEVRAMEQEASQAAN